MPPSKRQTAKSVRRGVAVQDRQLRVLQLITEQGMTLEQVAAEVGYAGKQGAAKARDAALAARDARVDGAVDAYRSQAEARLATVLAAIWDMCQDGDLEAIDRYVKVEARWSKMRGGDAPQKTELTGADGKPLVPQTPRVEIYLHEPAAPGPEEPPSDVPRDL